MKRSPALMKLTRVLARLFHTVEWSKMIVTNAGIEDGMIEYSTASLINWRNIVDASLRQGKLDRLVTFAIEDCQEEQRPQLQALLREHKEWWDRNPMPLEELVDGIGPQTFFDILLERALTRVGRILTVLTVLTLVAGIITVIHSFMPSNTSNFSIRGPRENDPSAFVAKIRNDGGRSAEFVDGSFALEFTDLPIQTHTNIILVDAKNARRIPGHDDVHITLTATTPLTPIAKQNGENCFPTEEEVKELLPNGQVVLSAKVEESGHREKTVRTEPVAASLIQPFILRAYPDGVPTLCH